MTCTYCRQTNSEEDHRCGRCGRRLLVGGVAAMEGTAWPKAGANSTVDPYLTLSRGSLALDETPAPKAHLPPPTHPRLTRPRQGSLFPENEKVIQFPGEEPAPPQRRTQPRKPRRKVAPDLETQPYLDFFPPVPNAPRTLDTTVEAVIYCDAPVATPQHRAIAWALDLSLVLVAMAVFLGAFAVCGGELAFTASNSPYFAAAFLLIAGFYTILWPLAGGETAGARWAGLRVVNFDGQKPSRSERFLRSLGAVLSFAAAGLGVLWALADEEGLTWHDHMTKTFPTIRNHP
ncbi:MAG: RDD family protein [Bryobacterales bacterium]|nr:RDD family protein [Bryobacterales bacterium]